MFSFAESVQVVEKRYAARLVQEGQATIEGLPAHAAVVDIENLDQLEADPDAPGSRLEIVLAHTNFAFGAYGPIAQGSNAASGRTFPVLLVVGYWNRAGEFSESLDDFHELLTRITIDGRSGASLSYPKAEPASEPAAPAETESGPEAATEAPPAAASEPAPAPNE